MKRAQIISILNEMHRVGLLSGPSSIGFIGSVSGSGGPMKIIAPVNGKNRSIYIEVAADNATITVTTGRFFKRKYNISTSELDG